MLRVVRVALRARSYNRVKCCSPSCWPFPSVLPSSRLSSEVPRALPHTARSLPFARAAASQPTGALRCVSPSPGDTSWLLSCLPLDFPAPRSFGAPPSVAAYSGLHGIPYEPSLSAALHCLSHRLYLMIQEICQHPRDIHSFPGPTCLHFPRKTRRSPQTHV